MSPLRGGEADKFGNRYEGRWTTRQLLYVLQGQVDSVTIEEAGEIGRGVEFTVRRPGKTEVHQVKRQHASANQWELFDLKANGVLAAAQDQVAKGRQFWFVSTVPIVVLDQLADAARRSSDLQSFVGHRLTSNPLRAGFDYLSGKAYGSAETAWQTLRGLEVLWPPERDLEYINNALAGLLLEGAEPTLAAVGLGNLVPDNLGVPLDVDKLIELLEPFGLRPKRLFGSPTIRQRVRQILISWRESVGRELLQPTIARSETSDLVVQLRNGPGRLSFVVGVGGGGKSAVMHQTVAEIEADGWPILALRLDRIEPFSSTIELGQRRNLDISPVTALAAVAQNGTSVLVIDQLDAVSLAVRQRLDHRPREGRPRLPPARSGRREPEQCPDQHLPAAAADERLEELGHRQPLWRRSRNPEVLPPEVHRVRADHAEVRTPLVSLPAPQQPTAGQDGAAAGSQRLASAPQPASQ